MQIGVGVGIGGVKSAIRVITWTFREAKYGVSQQGGFMFGASTFNQDTTGAAVTVKDEYSYVMA